MGAKTRSLAGLGQAQGRAKTLGRIAARREERLGHWEEIVVHDWADNVIKVVRHRVLNRAK